MAKSNNKTEMVIEVPSEPKKVQIELVVDNYGANLYVDNRHILTLKTEGYLELSELSSIPVPLQLDKDGFIKVVKEY